MLKFGMNKCTNLLFQAFFSEFDYVDSSSFVSFEKNHTVPRNFWCHWAIVDTVRQCGLFRCANALCTLLLLKNKSLEDTAIKTYRLSIAVHVEFGGDPFSRDAVVANVFVTEHFRRRFYHVSVPIRMVDHSRLGPPNWKEISAKVR